MAVAPHSWRAGDTALCGASYVRIAALDGGRALVVAQGEFGPWSIWMEASELVTVEERDHAAAPARRGTETRADVARVDSNQ